MSAGQIHGNGAALSASSALDAIGGSLLAIKSSTGLTDARLSDPLCKSPDRLRDYRESNSEMGAVTFLRAVAEWGPAFGDRPAALAGYRFVPLDATCTTVAGAQTALMRLGVKLAMALDPASHGGRATTAQEAKGMLGEIDEFQAHLDRLRALAVSV